MSNDLATLNAKLIVALRDPTYATWVTAEIDELLNRSVDALFPRFARPLDPETTTINVDVDDYYYALPSGVRAVHRVDRYDANGTDWGPIVGQAWELVGDVLAGTGKLHIGALAAQADDVLHLHGQGVYDTATNLIPDHLVGLVIARARAEGYRRVLADRERFKAWLTRNQNQNVSVNEMLQIVNESDAEANRLERMTARSWMRPVQGRIG